MSKPEYRQAERQAFCRGCDKIIQKGDHMVSFYSWRNRGQSIHICPKCAVLIGALAETGEAPDGSPDTE